MNEDAQCAHALPPIAAGQADPPPVDPMVLIDSDLLDDVLDDDGIMDALLDGNLDDIIFICYLTFPLSRSLPSFATIFLMRRCEQTMINGVPLACNT